MEEGEEGVEGGRGKQNSSHTSTLTTKKGKKVPPFPSKKKTKVRRRTVNPKKVKKGDRFSAGLEEDSVNARDGVHEGSPGGGGQGQGKIESDSSEEEEPEREEKDEEEWNRLQRSLQKHSKKKFEQNNTESHPVHAPFFPEVMP